MRTHKAPDRAFAAETETYKAVLRSYSHHYLQLWHLAAVLGGFGKQRSTGTLAWRNKGRERRSPSLKYGKGLSDFRDNSVSTRNLHKLPVTTVTWKMKRFTNTQRAMGSQAGRMGQRGLGLIPKQRVKEGVNLVLEMLVCITHRITASPGEAQRDGPSLPASISLSAPAGHLQGQKTIFSFILFFFFFFPQHRLLVPFPARALKQLEWCTG